MLTTNRHAKKLNSTLNGIFANRDHPIAAPLADKLTDVGDIPPYGRIDLAWQGRKMDFSTRPITGKIDHIPTESYYRDPVATISHFNLKGIEFGNWMNQRDRQRMLYGTVAALEDLAQLLGVPHKAIGMGGKLSIALGARGGGGQTLAHFEKAPYDVINLTKTGGWDGVFAHEYAHAVDELLRVALKRKMALSGGRRTVATIRRDADDEWGNRFEAIFKLAYGGGKWYRRMEKMPEYWLRREEVFARLFEHVIFHRMNEKPIKNFFLVQARKPAAAYPDIHTTELINDKMRNLVRDAIMYLHESDSGEKSISTRKGNLLYGEGTAIVTQTEEIPGHYAIVELSDLIPSHNAATFKPNPAYPPGCQQRDYTHDQSEQQKVQRNAQHWNPRFVITDTPSAVDGPPIVTPTLVVLGGNSRTMSAELVDDWKPYRSYLEKAAAIYGFTKDDITPFRRPFLVRVVNVDMTQCALYSNKLNKGLTQGLDLSTETISYARQLSAEDVQRVGSILEQSGDDTLSKFLEKVSNERALTDIFRRAKIITDQTGSTWVDPKSGRLSEQGRLLTERTLLGAVLPDKALVDAARQYTNQLLKTLSPMIRMQNLPDNWNLTPAIQDAIRAESERRSKGSNKRDFLAQESFDRPPIPELVRSIWDALDSGPKSWAAFLNGYVKQAEREQALEGGGSFGFDAPKTQQQVIDDLLEKKAARSAKPTTLGDVLAVPFRQLPLSTKWAKFFGRMADRFTMLVWGTPGAGKSHFALHFADELSRIGKTLYVSSEEPLETGGLKRRAETMGIRRDGVMAVYTRRLQDVAAMIRTHKFRFVVIDSVTALSDKPEAIFDMLDAFPATSFLLIAHASKDGRKYRGLSNLGHQVDTIVTVDAGMATIPEKNRFGPVPSSMRIFPHR